MNLGSSFESLPKAPVSEQKKSLLGSIWIEVSNTMSVLHPQAIERGISLYMHYFKSYRDAFQQLRFHFFFFSIFIIDTDGENVTAADRPCLRIE
jgi:hypothetical protein